MTKATLGIPALLVLLLGPLNVAADDEALVFTPPGFSQVGKPVTATGEGLGQLDIVVRDKATGRPTPCRINVVGPDGNFYQPAGGPLTPYSLTGEWPKTGKGNRVGKAPIRYFGRYFYSTGDARVAVPAGAFRVEVWKGLEYRPTVVAGRLAAGQQRKVDVTIEHAVDMAALGYDSGDSHVHIARTGEADDRVIFDLMEAEDIRYASLLAYNEPAGPYSGTMAAQDSPQRLGLGRPSIRQRGKYAILSGQEYRGNTFGHLNLFLRDNLVRDGQSGNTDDGPPYGLIGRDTHEGGGFAFYAHGGYSQSIYADFVQRDVDGVELLQFGVYRGIALDDWYRILNIGYRFPCIGASDYPACRKLGDCITYSYQDRAKPGDFPGWWRSTAEGRSFVTTGPLLLLDVDGAPPGAIVTRSGAGPHRVTARIRVQSLVTPITDLQLIVDGRVIAEKISAAEQRPGTWIELSRPIELARSSWIAARAFSTTRAGAPDAEAHTNPVYLDVDGKAAYDRAPLDHLVGKLDEQMAIHRKRTLAQKAEVLDYFQRSRDILMKIRAAGGLPSTGVPAAWLERASRETIRASARAHTDEELKEFLKPVPPRTPAEALQTFETVGGFRMELVAAEPLVASPVAGAFDEDGNLYVAEMRDYPYRPKPGRDPLGRVRMLRDTNGDGRFDESHVFAEGLMWPAGVACWKGGVFVAAPPDIWYFKDTDGDHRADVRRKVITGFGTENEQGILNNLAFGLDHKIYGSTSTNGGVVRAVDDPKSPSIDLRNKDFRFDPVTGAVEAITGTVQFGNTFDDWGNRFLCSESSPLRHAVLPLEYLARNPALAVPAAIADVAGHPVPAYRISPIERWRQIRSSRRIAHGERSAESAGASHHVIDAAAGATVYRGGAYPEPFAGNVFVCDAQNNLIHRMTLTPDGVTFKAQSADKATEFVRSYDNWFRPVNLINAPDGTLYVLDMSREVIEAIHIPLDVVRHLDLRRGRDQGRIYRIAPPGFHVPAPRRLSGATTAELVAALESPNAWARDTAYRLLHERYPHTPGLERARHHTVNLPMHRLLKQTDRPETRVLVLWWLRNCGELAVDDLIAALADRSAGVREHAVRLSERFLGAPEVLDKVVALAGDSAVRVRFQAAFTLGESRDPRAVAALARIARTDASDPWIRAAVLSSSSALSDRLLAVLLDDAAFATSAAGAGILDELALTCGVRNEPNEVANLLDTLASNPVARSHADLTRRLLVGLGQGVRRTGGRLTAVPGDARPGVKLLRGEFARAATVAKDSHAAEADRIASVSLLACGPYATARSVIPDLLEPAEPPALQVAALRALAGHAESDVAGLLIDRLPRLSPAAQGAAVESLLSREAWTLALLRAVHDGRIALPPLDAARKPLLVSHKNPEIAALAQKLLGPEVSAARTKVLADYASALPLAGSAERGSVLFGRHCMSCHRIGDRGHDVGPDLTVSQHRHPADLLTQVLDPNRSVPPNYVQYVVADRGGRVATGIIAAETATSLTLKRGDGVQETILRSQIEELTSTGKSLMPEGFERDLSVQDMADLLAYLQSSRRGRPDGGTGLDIGTLPGAVEPDE
jgi:putative membrane-bound dehydrogenase-like protein